MYMGRRRKSDKHLPQRVYLRRGKYYFVTIEHKWLPLGDDYGLAMANWAKLVAIPKTVTRMNDLFDRYMLEVAPAKAPRTYKDNQAEIRPLRAFFGGMRPEEVEPIHVYQYLDTRGKQAKIRANREKALLSHVFSLAIRWGAVKDNPCRNVKGFSEKPRSRYVEDWELAAFLEGAPEFIRHYTAFKYLTGLRQQDILNLRLDALREEGIHLITKKTGKRLVIQWNEDLHTVVESVKALRPIASMYLFCTRDGQPYSSNGFSSIWKRAMQKALESERLKEHFTEHDIRAKSGTDADAGGLNAQMLLGHVDAATTRRYIRHKQAVKVVPLSRKV
jgi:integrase